MAKAERDVVRVMGTVDSEGPVGPDGALKVSVIEDMVIDDVG